MVHSTHGLCSCAAQLLDEEGRLVADQRQRNWLAPTRWIRPNSPIAKCNSGCCCCRLEYKKPSVVELWRGGRQQVALQHAYGFPVRPKPIQSHRQGGAGIMATAKPRSRTGKIPGQSREAGMQDSRLQCLQSLQRVLTDRELARHRRFRPSSAKEGSTLEVGTVVYVRWQAISPNARCSMLRRDTAPFGASMGDRNLHSLLGGSQSLSPAGGGRVAPDGDRLLDAADAVGLQALADIGLERVPVLDAAARKLMDALEARLRGNEQRRPAAWTPSCCPLPEVTRLWITRRITKLFLRTCRTFSSMPASAPRWSRRCAMPGRGGGPHRHRPQPGLDDCLPGAAPAAKADCDVRLFVTIGSPLGLRGGQDGLCKIGQGEAAGRAGMRRSLAECGRTARPRGAGCASCQRLQGQQPRGVKAVDDSA